jgi:hypothetical protein
MKIVRGYPPLFAEIKAAFPAASRPGILFSWGDTIYNPSGVAIPPELMAHEGLHASRQKGDPESWWRRYIAEPSFRLTEELLAHTTEYHFVLATYGNNRSVRRRALAVIAGRLASPLYGSLISLRDAKIAIADPEKHFRTRLDNLLDA